MVSSQTKLADFFIFGLILLLTLPPIVHCRSVRKTEKSGCAALAIESKPNLTHRQLLYRKSNQGHAALFDKNHDDFDIFLRLMDKVNLSSDLDQFEKSNGVSTIFVPRDIAIIQTATEMHHILDTQNKKATSSSPSPSPSLPPSYLTELQSYKVILKFIRRYRYPHLVLVDIVRNHVSPVKISLCEYLISFQWKSWSNRTVDRSGIFLLSGNNQFDSPRLFISPDFPQIQTRQGIIQHIDRMLLPDLSKYELAPTPTPSASLTPSISPSSSPGTTAPQSPSSTPSEQPATPSPSMSLKPSAPPIPVITDPFTPFPSLGSSPVPSPTSAGKNTPGSISQPSSATCFPASAAVHLSRTVSIKMKDLAIGQNVMSSKNSQSQVFMFSHRLETRIELFLQLHTVDFNLTISHGHLLYVNGRLQAASTVKIGDVVSTLNGNQHIEKIDEIWDHGLFAPHTMDGNIVVNGILASCYTTAVESFTAHTLLAPLRALVRTQLVQDPLKGALDYGVHPLISRLFLQLATPFRTSI